MSRWLQALALAALLPAGGCGVGDPADVDPLLVISGPEAFQLFELRDGGDEVLWRLVANEAVPVGELVYGEVPPGFRQETPADGSRPRQLLTGEPLSLESITPRRVFHHEGFAAHGQRFSIDRWQMILRDPPAVAEDAESPGGDAPLDAPPDDS